MGNPGPVDPEEAFIASLSSCHMLTFLAIAAKKRLVVDAYDDHAVGVMAKNERGRIAITQVTLHPKIVFAGEQPDAAALERIHHRAHEECFIANSVTTEIIVA
nr:OsmC family protein [Kribbella italica]